MSIIKSEKSITTGNDDSKAQVFLRTHIPTIIENPVSFFNFEMPLFNLEGATTNYYEQSTEAISTNVNNEKTLTLNFTANTETLSGTTQLSYDIYRLDIETYLDAKNNIENGITGGTDINSVQSLLSNPIYTIEESVSAMTTAHTISLPSVIKPTDEFATDLFFDKYQYFVDTTYGFDKPVDATLGNVIVFSSETGSYIELSALTSSATTLYTETSPQIITATTFSGSSFKGVYFVYFTAPNKPDINILDDAPTVAGTLSTYSPVFSFNNVEDGDRYKLELNYNVNDEDFTGDTTSFDINKQEGDSEFIRTYSIALSPESQFLYRIGNVKEVESIFGVKYSVTSWGEIESATTASDGSYTLSGVVYFGGSSSADTLSGITIQAELLSAFSDVSLNADSRFDDEIFSDTSQAIDSSVGTTYSAISSSDGSYSFASLVGGTYKVTITLESITSQYNVILNKNTNLDLTFDENCILYTMTDTTQDFSIEGADFAGSGDLLIYMGQILKTTLSYSIGLAPIAFSVTEAGATSTRLCYSANNVVIINLASNSITTFILPSFLTHIAALDLSVNDISAYYVDKMLVKLDSDGTLSGTLDLGGGTNATPTNGATTGFDGLTAASNLGTKGWVITIN